MFCPLPVIEPRDSHTLWYSPSQPSRSAPGRSQGGSHQDASNPSQQNASSRRAANASQRGMAPSRDSLAALMFEERALRVRKQNIASFGFAWIRPAGFPKTMLGIREEELEREEGAAAAAAAAAEDFVAEGDGQDTGGDMDEALERDLDGEIPDADDMVGVHDDEEDEDGEIQALIERGEGGDLEEEDEDGLMGRDLDDDIPNAFGDEYDDDDQRDLDDDVPSASDTGVFDEDEEDPFEEEEEDSMMARNLDSDVPGPAEDDPVQEQEWEHTDTDAEDDEEDDDMDIDDHRRSLPRHSLRSNVSAFPEPAPFLPPQPRRETEAERRFLERWSDGGSAGLGSSEMVPEPSLRIPRRRTRRYSAQSDSTNSIE